MDDGRSLHIWKYKASILHTVIMFLNTKQRFSILVPLYEVLHRSNDLLATDDSDLRTRQYGHGGSEHVQQHESECEAHGESENVQQHDPERDAHEEREERLARP